jgi:ABC-type transport system substrate-binding protein/class 3 adenylate cyclase/streptogramin lyase
VTESQDPAVDQTEGSPSPVSQPATPGTELRTFLIADIRGYTTYTRERGDEAGAALAARFGELVAEVVPAHDGFLLELRGDEALVVFVSARKALRAAIDLQAKFVQAELPRGVGIGLDAGEAIPVGSGYRGTALNLAARLCAEAGPGETMASEAVIHLAAKMDGIAYVDARALRLKGYVDSVRVVDVVPSERAKGRRLASGDGARGPRTREAIAVAVVFLVVVFVAGVVGGGFLGRGGAIPSASPLATPTGSPDPLGGAELPVLAFYDPTTGALKATTHLATPRNISFYAAGSFWILGENPSVLYRIDSATHAIAKTISVPFTAPSGFNYDDDFIWVTDLEAPHIARIDQKTGVVTDQSFAKDASDDAVGVDVTAGAGSVWVSRPDADPPEIVRLNRVTGAIEARIPVEAWGVTFGAGGLWWWRQGTLGRIDPITNEETFSLDLATDTFLGNIYIGGEDAWTSSTSTGRVWRVDRSGHQTTYTLPPGVSEFAATDRTMWATNASTGQLIGIDLVSGQQDRTIETGHATVAVAAGGNELMIAVAPTVDEYIAGLQGSVLSLATDGIPWWDPAPDPPDVVNDQVRQSLYLTCANVLGHPDKPGPEGTELVPEVADMPSVSADGLTYTFTIRPGYQFSPPSNEQVTADTFRYTLERALSPLYGDAPGPNVFGDIAGAQDYREGTVDHVRGLSVAGNQLNITLEKPAPDILERLASSFACPVPIGTPSLRSGLNPDPPVAGDGPYYLAQRIPKWLVVFKKNPNYHGSRLQPFDAIVIRTKTSATTAIGMVSNGTVDGAMLNGGDSLTGPASALAAEWGPGSPHATQGDQRWFGGSGTGIDFIALNPSSPTLKDPDIRHAISLALDRVELGSIWVNPQTAELLIPSVRGSDPSAVVQPPNLEAANALMKGRQVKLTMLGFPEDWGCGRCRDYEIAVTGQLKAIGITVTVRHGDPDNHPGPAFDKGSDVDLIAWGMGSDYPDPVALLGGLHDIPWIGPANLAELDRLNGLSGQDRVDGVVAFAHRLVDEQFLILPTSHAGTPFFLSDRLGCAFVQEAIGTVDFLSLCIKDSATPAASASPSP